MSRCGPARGDSSTFQNVTVTWWVRGANSSMVAPTVGVNVIVFWAGSNTPSMRSGTAWPGWASLIDVDLGICWPST